MWNMTHRPWILTLSVLIALTGCGAVRHARPPSASTAPVLSAAIHPYPSISGLPVDTKGLSQTTLRAIARAAPWLNQPNHLVLAAKGWTVQFRIGLVAESSVSGHSGWMVDLAPQTWHGAWTAATPQYLGRAMVQFSVAFANTLYEQSGTNVIVMWGTPLLHYWTAQDAFNRVTLSLDAQALSTVAAKAPVRPTGHILQAAETWADDYQPNLQSPVPSDP